MTQVNVHLVKTSKETIYNNMILGVSEVSNVNDTTIKLEDSLVLGLIEAKIDNVYQVQWLVDPKTINYDRLCIYSDKMTTYDRFSNINLQTFEHGLIENDTPVESIWDSLDKAYTSEQLVLVDESVYEQYTDLAQAVNQIHHLTSKYPMYDNIMINTETGLTVFNLLTAMKFLAEEDRLSLLRAFKYSRKQIHLQQRVAEKCISKLPLDNGRDLMTQEQQVESFIEFSKHILTDKEEKVSDELIDKIRTSDLYQNIIKQLEDKSFHLSETQQFNVLQQVGLLSQDNENIIYNLSDMGSGKTLMTVEAIALLDLKMAQTYKLDGLTTVYLPNKNIIAPKLSIKSSWVKTFELFYDVKEVDDYTYELTFTYNDILYKSYINASPFTVNNNSITVDKPLPEMKYLREIQEYLIIDEIHQLVQKPVLRTRFFPQGVSPIDDYKSFILSGTLSNLTTNQWYNYIRFMNINDFDDNLSGTNKVISNRLDTSITNIRDRIRTTAEDLKQVQRCMFDPEEIIDEFENAKHSVKSNIEYLYHTYYSSLILQPTHHTQYVESLLVNNNYELLYDPNLSDTPNFELFYNLIGDKAITAQSLQVAEELFGKQQTQHKADVIKTQSPLTSDDLEILKTLHKIAGDHHIYKSTFIANRINNAILNLNDGLQVKSIYDIISQHASSNSRFLTYLSTLDLDILEKLPESNLIHLPKLEDTEKFQILKDILEQEKDETHLIVVNDYQSMVKLSKALKLSHLSAKQVRDSLSYQESLDEMFEKQSVVIVPQNMIKSSLDLVQANRLIQYQLNSEISDIIQTQNRINRIGQTRETKAYYIATDLLQENLIELFLETYRNIRVAHKGIVELFVDMSSQINVVNDYIGKALKTATVDSDQHEPSLQVDSEQYEQLSLFDDTQYIVNIPEPEIEQENIEITHSNPAQLVLFSLDDDYKAHQFAM